MLTIHKPKVTDIRPSLGCDPEFFFKSKAGEVIGAEKVLPKGGLKAIDSNNRLIIDGVQAELNPNPSTCREVLAANIRACFRTLDSTIKSAGSGVTLDFSRTIEISKENLMELEKESRMFGCAPSKSIYQEMTGIKIENVDPTVYRTRAAGGHIHLGHGGIPELGKALINDHIKTIEMLDILCGNTSVLVDLDVGNIERRKVYGKAGEFRQPKHGLEYRTLSNYWLTAPPLMSLAFGMARLAVQIMADKNNSETFYNAITSRVKAKNIHDAINYNDYGLALDNFTSILDILLEITPKSPTYPINESNIKQFDYFVAKVKEQGLGYWFKKSPLEYWTATAQQGFNDFLVGTVAPEMKKAA